MPLLTRSDDSITACSELIENTNHLLRQMLQTLQTLNISPETAAPALIMAAQQQQFTELQTTIEANSHQLSSALQTLKTERRRLAPLLEERHNLLIDLKQQNTTARIRAKAIQSLIGDELRKSSAGQTALKGYRSTEYRRRPATLSKTM
ncbi:MAG: hypothetical protein ACK5PS_02155 [Desulfopila sp.]